MRGCQRRAFLSWSGYGLAPKARLPVPLLSMSAGAIVNIKRTSEFRSRSGLSIIDGCHVSSLVRTSLKALLPQRQSATYSIHSIGLCTTRDLFHICHSSRPRLLPTCASHSWAAAEYPAPPGAYARSAARARQDTSLPAIIPASRQRRMRARAAISLLSASSTT